MAGPLLSGDHHVSYQSQKHPFAFHQAALFNVGIILMMLLLLSQGCQGYNNPQSSTKGESQSHPVNRCKVKQTD